MLNSLFTEERQARLAGALCRHYWTVLATALLLSFLCALGARKLRLDSDMVALLPQDSPAVTDLRQLTDKLGGTGDLQIMIRSPDAQSSVDFGESILPRIRELPWVQQASLGADTSFFSEHKLLYTDIEDLHTIEQRLQERIDYETLRAQPFYIDLEDRPAPSLDFSEIEAKYRSGETLSPYYRNKSGTVLLLLVQPSGIASDIAHAKKVQRTLQELIDKSDPTRFHPQMQVEVGGAYRNRINEYQAIVNDVRGSSVIVALAILLFLVLYFRHAMAAILVTLPLLMSLTWTFALTFLLIGRLNMVTVFLIVVLMGLGIDFGIHMLARFQDERERGAEVKEALAQMLSKAGRASLTAALTTAACFLALIVTQFRGFVEFGVIASIGLVMSALAYFTVLPALLALVSQWRWMRPRLRVAARDTPLASHRRGARFLLGACVLLIAGAVYIGRNAEFEYDLRNLRARMPETRDFNRRVREVFPKARDPAAVLVHDASHARELVAELERRREATLPHSPIESVLSAEMLMPRLQDEKLEILHRLGAKLDDVFEILDDEEREAFASIREDLQVKRIDEVLDLPAPILRKFFGEPGTPGQIVYVYQSGSLMDLRVAMTFSELLDNLRVDDTTYRAVSEPLIYVTMLRSLQRETPKALLLSGFALIALLLWDFRSIKSLLFVLIPLGAGLIVMVASMALIPIRLNFVNAIVLPSMLGLGVDGGVHIYHSVQERGVGALGRVLRETGSAVAACTLTSLLGFSGMLAAKHLGLRSLGELALVGLLGCFFGALVVLPALIASSSKIEDHE